VNINEYIKKFFHYNPETGIISRDDRKNSSGCLDKGGYLILKIKGKQYKSHRIAWFLYYGYFPNKFIDHINRNRLDNRIVNLRDVSAYVNSNNIERHPHPTTGIIGIWIDNYTKGLKKKYTLKFNTKTYRFYTLNEAIEFKKKNNLPI
jgi:hypothetical protein